MSQYGIRIIGAIFAACLLLAGAIAYYGGQQTLPRGIAVSGEIVGGLTLEEAAERIGEMAKQLEQKAITLEAELQDNVIQRPVRLGNIGLRTNHDQLLLEIGQLFQGSVWERAWKRWQFRNQQFTLHAALDEQAFRAAMKQLWPEFYNTQPVDAVRIITSDDRVTYKPEQPARRIDEIMLRKNILNRIGSTSVVAVPAYEEPANITVETLKAQGIERLISSYTTTFAGSGSGRRRNVESTASVVHDTLLAPEEVFDFADIIRKTEEKYGFCEAPVIISGKLVPGIGGGICQVSTTLYNAALRAGLDIVERRNHSLPISYAPLGQDATFASGYINFRFRNSTGKHLLIRTETKDGKLTVKLFGTLDPSITYEIKSRTLETIKPPVKFVKNPQLKKGEVVLLQPGKPGYVVETIRIKKVNGNITARERISKDTYKAQPAIYASNAGKASEKNTDPSGPIIEDGVPSPET